MRSGGGPPLHWLMIQAGGPPPAMPAMDAKLMTHVEPDMVKVYPPEPWAIAVSDGAAVVTRAVDVGGIP